MFHPRKIVEDGAKEFRREDWDDGNETRGNPFEGAKDSVNGKNNEATDVGDERNKMNEWGDEKTSGDIARGVNCG